MQTPVPDQRPLEPGEDMGTPNWYGWAVGLYDGDCISFARSPAVPHEAPDRSGPSPACPSLAEAWEAMGEEDWEAAEDIRVTVPNRLPDMVHAWHCTGVLSGTYGMGDDVDGRTSYKREDGKIVVSWSAEAGRWSMDWTEASAAKRAEEASQQPLYVSAQVDALDPTWLKQWYSWDEATNKWKDDPGLALNPGPMPPQQLYVSKCRYTSLDGVYNVMPTLMSGRPAYQRDSSSSHCAIRWHKAGIWLIDERGLKDDTLGDARSKSMAQRPHEAAIWEECAVGSSDANVEAGNSNWALANLSMEVVGAAPEQIFVEVMPSSPVFGARGVYTVEVEKCNFRACFSKAAGSWRCFWNPEKAAWSLKSSSSEKNPSARIVHDVPEPVSYKSSILHWQFWNSAAREWQKDQTMQLSLIPVPPRRLHVSAQKARKNHTLFGVYFLRGMHNGRPTWAKETIASSVGIQRSSQRGTIYWGGEKEPCWLVVAEPEASRVYKARLHDDTPLPSERIVVEWEMQEPAGEKSAKKHHHRQNRLGMVRSSSPPPSSMSRSGGAVARGRVISKARTQHMGPLASLMANSGSGAQRGGRSGSKASALGPLGMPVGAASAKDARRLGGGVIGPLGVPKGAQSMREGQKLSRSMSAGSGDPSSDVLEGAEEASDDDGTSTEEEDEPSRGVKLTCLSADESPGQLFLHGHSSKLDCTLWLHENLHDGRALYESELGTAKLQWERFKQRWVLQIKGQFFFEEALSNTSDCPDPSLTRSSWEKLVEGSRPASAASSNSSSTDGGLEMDMTFAIEEGSDEDEEEEEVAHRKSSKTTVEVHEEKPRWTGIPTVKCLTVDAAPAKIFVTGPGSKTDFTGIFSIDPASVGKRRPAYVAEHVGFATPCTIRFVPAQNRWIIERVPQLKGRHIRIAQKPDSMTFVLAGAQYDAPNPVLIQSCWEVRQGENWLPEERIKCRIVKEPPKCVCLFGEFKKMDHVAGTFRLIEDGKDRPNYRKEGTEQTVTYRKESKSWVLSDHPGDLPRGAMTVECNVPNPVETHDAVWRAWSSSLQEWQIDESFGCYAGEMPPKQIFCIGGRLGVSGVYTFMWRKLHNEHFAYRKEGTGWHAWWSSRLKRWVVGMLHKSELEHKVERGGAANFADAWCSDDVPHPAACQAWRFKARRWAPGCKTNTWRGVITNKDIADALGERPFTCVPVTDPPKVIAVTHAEDRKTMAGVYFLAHDLHAKRCYYQKQHNSRRSEEWVIYYNPPTGRWHIDRHGLKGQGRANASIACDSPDPTLVWGKWNIRHSDREMSSSSLTIAKVTDVPKKVFVFGAALKRVSGGQTTKEDLPINGVFLLRDSFHCRRASYVKEVDSNWCIRFHAESARWIVDGRGPPEGSKDSKELRDDSTGSGSVLFDCWQPADSDWPWSLWMEAKSTKLTLAQRAQQQQQGPGEPEVIPEDASQMAGDASPQSPASPLSPKSAWGRPRKNGPVSGSIADLSPRSRKDGAVMEGRLTLSKIQAVLGKPNAPMRQSGVPDVSNADDDDSQSDAQSGISGISGLHGPGGGRHISSRMSSSGHSVKSKISMCSSHKSGRARSISGSSMNSGTSSRSGGASEHSTGSKNSNPKAQQYESWVDCPSIRVVAVGETPERIYFGPTEPADLTGIYARCGDCYGRPLYRLINPDGTPKTCTETCGLPPVEVEKGGIFTDMYKKKAKRRQQAAAAGGEMVSPPPIPGEDGGGKPRRESADGSEMLVGDSSADDSSSAAEQSRPSSPRGSSSASAGPSRLGQAAGVPNARAKQRWRQAGAFDFSPYGYVLRWHPPSNQWILSEYCTTFVVTYDSLAPRFDLSLEGGNGEAVRVAFLRDHGPASLKGVPVNSEVVAIDDDREMFKYQDGAMLLRDVETPVTLTFKGAGLVDNTDGLMFLRYDAPFPHSVTTPWLVPFDGGFFFPMERAVQACNIECPPRRVQIFGHKGKSKDLSDPFELQPLLLNGKPAYQGGRWCIFWVPSKRRWTICRADVRTEAVLSDKKSLSYTQCHAPHPAAVCDHGGRWQTRHVKQRKGVKVVALTPPIELHDYEEIVVHSLEMALQQASDRQSVTGRMVDGRMRFDPAKISSVLAGLNTVLSEVDVFGMQSELVQRAADVRRRLSGWLNLESLLCQGEKGEEATTASWMEALTELKARLRQDHADATVCYEEDGWTTLHIVARYGFNEAWTYEAADALRHCGAEVEVYDKNGMSPIMLAVTHRKIENVRALLRLVSERAVLLPLDLKAKAQAESNFLQEAEKGCDSALLRKFVMSKLVDVNSRGPGMKTALHVLALRNQAAAVELLVKEAGADADSRDGMGNTPLHLAAGRDAHLTAQTLFRMGASPIIRNTQGKTAYMEAIEGGAMETVAEMCRRMVHWEDIEGILGRRRHREAEDWRALVREKVRELIRMGFGNEKVDPMSHAGTADKLQLANQVVVVEPGPGAVRCCLLELRGSLICQELLLPLLRLAGECRLKEADDGVQYASFLRYCLHCGLSVFGGVDVELAVMRGLQSLRHACFDAVEEVKGDLRTLTPCEEMIVGRAAGDHRRQPWPMCHQYFAHGDLPWLSCDGRRQDLLSALGTLVEEDEWLSVEQLTHSVIADKDLVQSTSTSATKTMLRPFWEGVYARWLVRYAKKGMKKLEAFGRGRNFRMGELRSLKSVLEAKVKHRDACWQQFGGEEEKDFQLGMAMPPHVMEAGGITDILHCSIAVDGIQDVFDMFDQLRSMTLESDCSEVVFVRNAFWEEREEEYDENGEEIVRKKKSGENTERPPIACPNVCFRLMVEVPGCTAAPAAVPVLLEVRLFLVRHDILRQHVELLQEYEEGAYNEVMHGVRQAMGFRTIASKKDGQRRSMPKFVATKRRFAIPAEFPGPNPELKARDKVWCWSKITQLEDMGLLTLPSTALVLTGDPMMQGSMLFTVLEKRFRRRLAERQEEEKEEEAPPPPQKWLELRGNGQMSVELTEDNLGTAWSEHDSFVTKAELVEHMSHERWLCLDEKDVDRILMEVACHEVRLFHSPTGVLTKIRDAVLVHIKAPRGKAILVRESLPCCFPTATRRSNESPAMAAKRAINSEVPSFLSSQMEVRDFQPEDGAWIEQEVSEEEAKAQGTIPIWKRTFVVKAKFRHGPDPYSLLRAGIGIDEREDVADGSSDSEDESGKEAGKADPDQEGVAEGEEAPAAAEGTEAA